MLPAAANYFTPHFHLSAIMYTFDYYYVAGLVHLHSLSPLLPDHHHIPRMCSVSLSLRSYSNDVPRAIQCC